MDKGITKFFDLTAVSRVFLNKFSGGGTLKMALGRNTQVNYALACA